jgi:hypothetical protein
MVRVSKTQKPPKKSILEQTADAFNLGRVQRIDLRPALALLLMADTQREQEPSNNFALL